MTKTKNWNCDGAYCTSSNSEVRIYPLGSGGNLILCHACFAHENRYRMQRTRQYLGGQIGSSLHRVGDWPQVNWTTAERYDNTQEST